jgi:hypothetical protein
VATDWGPVIQTGVGAAAALGGGAVGAWLQARSQERIDHRRLRHEQRIERQQRRDRAAALLAEVSAVLTDIGSHRLALQHTPPDPPGMLERMKADYERIKDRQKVLREPLMAMAIGDPSPTVRHLIRELERTLHSSLWFTWYRIVNRGVGPMDDPDLARVAENSERDYRKAHALLDELIEAL